MKTYDHNKAERKYRKYYKRSKKSEFCFYCGEISEATDHVPALRVVESLGPEFFVKNNTEMVVVDSCVNCNSILGTKGETIEKRFDILIERHKEFLDFMKKRLVPEGWTLEELSELDYNLKSYVLDPQNHKNKGDHALELETRRKLKNIEKFKRLYTSGSAECVNRRNNIFPKKYPKKYEVNQ